ncbi:MAG: hypothetical protein IPK79_04955 [Vampirovibrionales bacterium]|nr:hypothetical protein [Vampirovibrionales bacterium]
MRLSSVLAASNSASPLIPLGVALAGKALDRLTAGAGGRAGDFQGLLSRSVTALEKLAHRVASPDTAPSLGGLTQSARWLASVDTDRNGQLSRAELETAASKQDPMAQSLLARYQQLASADGQPDGVSLADLAMR